MILTRNKTETGLLIDGPSGKLELLLANPMGDAKNAFGIICHPHSLFGGSLTNKVVTTLAKTYQALGLFTVRFNFRGVGKSEGVFDEGSGELEDLITVIDWVKQERPQQEIWLAGFSFGAYVAAKAATELSIQQLVTVAPPVLHFHMDTLAPILCPWVLAQGDQDEVVPADAVIAWAEKRDPKPTILRFPQASHFFHGQLTELRMALEKVLSH